MIPLICLFVKYLAFLKKYVDLLTPVDWSGRRETPAGTAGQVRPRSGEARRRITARPRISERLQRKSTAKFN
ncbi:hypothetical protein [Bacillus sp. SJS]|uniref:hypothetical protein n=1 Tax=Bacillus sp. SJS TaxID=1423321 RepID=UPI0012E86B15|nr:hypothetical protein [Bacillus sp. SJS]